MSGSELEIEGVEVVQSKPKEFNEADYDWVSRNLRCAKSTLFLGKDLSDLESLVGRPGQQWRLEGVRQGERICQTPKTLKFMVYQSMLSRIGVRPLLAVFSKGSLK